MKILHLMASGYTGGIEILCNSILRFNKEDNHLCCMFEVGEIYNSLKEDNYNVFSCQDCNRNITKTAKKIKDYIINNKIDSIIVHHGGIKCNLVYNKLKKILKNENVLFSRYFHGCYSLGIYGVSTNKLKNIIIHSKMQKAINNSDLIIYISKAVKNTFENSFEIEKDKQVVIYNGVDIKFYENSIDLVNKEQNSICFIGRLSKLKGVDLLINAISIIKEKIPNVHLTIVGTGNEEKTLKEMSDNLKLTQNITFVGRQENVIPFLDKSQIFVYPSICEEGFGISVAEAMTRGCTPITSDHGGLPEVFENRKSGFLVEEINEKNLADKIIEVLTMKPEKREEIVKNTIKKSDQYRIGNYYACLIDAIEKTKQNRRNIWQKYQ